MQPPGPTKVLIIEDNAIDREVYKRYLWESTTGGFEFAEADCATTGIEMAATWRPDCALIDVNLPDMDGIEALTRLAGDSGRVPFASVVLTAFSGEAVAVRAIQAGAMDYLPKDQVIAGTLPHAVVRAIERFQLKERIEAQRSALEDSGRRYRLLLEAMPQMVWTADAQGRLLYANPRWLEYTGLSLADAGGFGWDRLVHPDDRGPTWQAWSQAVASNSVLEIEHRLRCAADGAYRWYLVRAVPMRGGHGEITDWFGTCTEIESQKRTSEALLEKQKFESLGRMAGGLAHDFNNLLMTILGGTSLAIEKLPIAHPAHEALHGVVQSSERAAELVRKMLAYAGKGNIWVSRTNVGPVVRDAIQRASIPAGIRVDFRSASDLPTVETDVEQLRQAVVDLVRNSAEAIGERASGIIWVRTGTAEVRKEGGRRGLRPASIAPGRYVTVEVRDNGCGIDEETQKQIFDPFFTTKFAGRGLGLAAVRGFAQSNGGGVQVYSVPGKGARFRVFLPVSRETELRSRSQAAE